MLHIYHFHYALFMDILSIIIVDETIKLVKTNIYNNCKKIFRI